MPPFKHQTPESSQPAEQHQFDHLPELTIRNAETGSNILLALAQVLEEADARSTYVEKVRGHAEAILKITSLHPHTQTEHDARFSPTAQNEHVYEITKQLTAIRNLFPVDYPANPEHKQTFLIAQHSDWIQDGEGRIYDPKGDFIARNLSVLTPFMHELGWLSGDGPVATGIHWVRMPEGMDDTTRGIERTKALRKKIASA